MNFIKKAIVALHPLLFPPGAWKFVSFAVYAGIAVFAAWLARKAQVLVAEAIGKDWIGDAAFSVIVIAAIALYVLVGVANITKLKQE